MKAVLWGRLVILLMLVMGMGIFPLGVTAQDEDVPYPGGNGSETGYMVVSKLVCVAWDLTAQDPCVGGPYDPADGLRVDFLLIGPDDTGEEFEFNVTLEFGGEAGASGGYYLGYVRVTDVPVGTYELCESVPAGYEGFGVVEPGVDAQDNCVVFEVTPGNPNQADESGQYVTFVNIPEAVEELPDTGAGLPIAIGSTPSVPVLLSGALLVLLVGLWLRSTKRTLKRGARGPTQ